MSIMSKMKEGMDKERIIRIPLRSLVRPNAYLVQSGDDWSLIDTGTRACGLQILRYLRRHRMELQHILLTHAHPDHIGGLKALLVLKEANVYLHEEDLRALSASRDSLLPTGRWRYLFRLLDRILSLIPKLDSLQALIEGDRISGMKVVHAPGHTPGSILLFHPDRKALFTGDTLCTKGEGPILPSRYWSRDWSGLLRSLRRAMEVDFDLLFPGHGPAILEGAREKVGAFIHRIEAGEAP